jgi:CTP:phosphocholine cytidylyltransferase-like protein
VNFAKALPEKDFKARVVDGKILEVSIHIFDDNCFAFQPFYKMDKATAAAWIAKVEEFIEKGENKCYAENALNEIFASLNVRAFSYEGYYIDEIDNLDDYARVMEEILPFDRAEQ